MDKAGELFNKHTSTPSPQHTHFNTYKRQKTSHVLPIALKSRQKKEQKDKWISILSEILLTDAVGGASV